MKFLQKIWKTLLVMLLGLTIGSVSVVHADDQFLHTNTVMLDVSRGHLKYWQIKRFINNVDPQKFKYVQLHLNDNEGLAVKTNLLQHQGWISKRQLRRLNQFADQRGLILVPDIDVPSHDGGIIQDLNHCHSSWLNQNIVMDSQTLDYTNPATLTFVRRLYREILPCFDRNTVMIGADEVPGNVANAVAFSDFLNGLDQTCRQLGYQNVVVWNDSLNPQVQQRLNHDVIVADWNHDQQVNNFATKNANSDNDYYNVSDLNNYVLRSEKAIRFVQHNQHNNMLCLWGSGNSIFKEIDFLNQVQRMM